MKHFVFLGVVWCCLSACSLRSSSKRVDGYESSSLCLSSSEEEIRNESELRWWKANFRFHWPENQSAKGVYDLILTEELFRPLLRDNLTKVSLWRVHRRANRDSAGHQLSLIFIAEEEDARALTQELSNSAVLLAFKEGGMIEWWGVSPYTSHKSEQGLIALGSDNHWSSPLQRSWPYFMTGASRMWMELLHERVEALRPEGGFADFSEALLFYEQVDSEMAHIWEKEGSHAFFHHLSALFGYRGIRFSGGGKSVVVFP